MLLVVGLVTQVSIGPRRFVHGLGGVVTVVEVLRPKGTESFLREKSSGVDVGWNSPYTH